MSSGFIICPICLEKLGDTEKVPTKINPSKPPRPTKSSPSASASPSSFNIIPDNPHNIKRKQDTGTNSEVKVTECGHIYHSTCINNWLAEGKSECPTCRGIIILAKTMTIYPQFTINDEVSDSTGDLRAHNQLRNIIFENMESIQTSICYLEEKIYKAYSNSKAMPTLHLQPTSSASASTSNPHISQSPPKALNLVDRIAEILRMKQNPGTSLEREIVDLKESIGLVNHEMDELGDKVGQLTGIAKDKKPHKELVDSLAKINKLISEDKALRNTLEKRVFKLKPKDTLLLMNNECNRVSNIGSCAMAENYSLKRDIRVILSEFREIKKSFGKALENLICLQTL